MHQPNLIQKAIYIANQGDKQDKYLGRKIYLFP